MLAAAPAESPATRPTRIRAVNPISHANLFVVIMVPACAPDPICLFDCANAPLLESVATVANMIANLFILFSLRVARGV